MTPAKSFLWPKGEGETWLLNPPLRYVVPSDQQVEVQDYLEAWSELKTSANYRQLTPGCVLGGKKVLIERHRDRGIGDLLFMTGPLHYLQHFSAHAVKIYFHASTDKGLVLHGNPHLHNEMPLAGPVLYDTLPLYNYHWFVDAATEYDEEADQLNVYDSLYLQLGIDYAQVPVQFKRPVMKSYSADHRRRTDLFSMLYHEQRGDWRGAPYWVVAPTTLSSLRVANYGTWLTVINSLAEVANVIVVGQANNSLLPVAGLSFN